MKNIVLINASPKINEQSASKYLVDAVGTHIDEATANIISIDIRQSITKHKTQEDFATISKADAVIIAFPLYIFCLPGILTRFLEDYYKFYIEHRSATANAKVYAIVNCGFPEPGINLEAVKVIRSFCHHVNAHFRFGVLIGGGGLLVGSKDAPFMEKTISNLNDAFLTIVMDIESNDLKNMDNINIAINFPRLLYLSMGDRGWHALARKNGLQKEDLYKRPYR